MFKPTHIIQSISWLAVSICNCSTLPIYNKRVIEHQLGDSSTLQYNMVCHLADSSIVFMLSYCISHMSKNYLSWRIPWFIYVFNHCHMRGHASIGTLPCNTILIIKIHTTLHHTRLWLSECHISIWTCPILN